MGYFMGYIYIYTLNVIYIYVYIYINILREIRKVNGTFLGRCIAIWEYSHGEYIGII